MKKRNPLALVVDDDRIAQAIISGILEDCGYSSLTANNGKEAVELVDINNFNLITMDLNMPIMNGIEATKKIRFKESKENQENRILIIGITAHTDKATLKKCLQSGMDFALTKPIDAKHFRKLIYRPQ